MRKKCPCCGYYTVDSDDEVIVDICEVCFWQYKKYGACKVKYANSKWVREPLPEEMPELFEKKGQKFSGMIQKEYNNPILYWMCD